MSCPYRPVEAVYAGIAEETVRFTMQHQLLDEAMWQRFVSVFRTDDDTANGGWRCEYWGKMMRGGVLTYMYTKDESLYRVLEGAVEAMLSAQRADGRFSTYAAEQQLFGWDMWGRKYVLIGFLHFYRICQSEVLKTQILAALCRHADAILAAVGEEDGKKSIFDTSNHWGGVNSCSILEPMVSLYSVTGDERYLAFARYLVSVGGCSDGNLIDLALAGDVMPYMYPEVKAYETMSYFEGVLAYYEVTGEEKYREAVLRFAEAVAATDITVIGCAGCTHELFDHSAETQPLYHDGFMQETCVTVTWMRLNARLYQLTGAAVYIDRLERSAFNALYGSVNTHMNQQLRIIYSNMRREYVPGLPFDSYSPLYNNRRGYAVGGFQLFTDGGFYGCCAAIAAAGVALVPLYAAVQGAGGVTVNIPMSGTLKAASPSGQRVTMVASTVYPRAMDYTVRLSLPSPEAFSLRLRVPAFCEGVRLTVNGAPVSFTPVDGYALLSRVWADGDTVALTADGFAPTAITLSGRTAFSFGPLMLARDENKEEGEVSLTAPIKLVKTAAGVAFASQPPQAGEAVRLLLSRADGEPPLLLTDYASCGKNWMDMKNRMTVWMNME